MAGQNQNANNIPNLLPTIAVLDPNSVPQQPLNGGDNEGITVLHEPIYLFPFGVEPVIVQKHQEILESLMEIAQEREIFFLGAHGNLSYIELCNRQDAPVPNTVLQGNFSIRFFEGNMVIPKENEPNRASRVVVQVIGEDGKIRGGPVRKLITNSPVQIMMSTTSRGGIENWARNAYIERVNNNNNNNNGFVPQVPNNAKRNEYVNGIYENTLREINQRNTFAWRCSQFNDSDSLVAAWE